MTIPEAGAELDRIAADEQVCTRCALHMGARQAVPGVGAAHAEVMLIAEAPSGYDDQHGYPFSGPSGAFLDELLTIAGLERAGVYLTNVVKHRVPDQRDLLAGEIAACAGYLTREIATVRPILIVAMGRAAATRFFPRVRITQMHGHVRNEGSYLVLATFNPAAALHREEMRPAVVDDFSRALPAALADARRMAAAGQFKPAGTDDDAPQQLSLF